MRPLTRPPAPAPGTTPSRGDATSRASVHKAYLDHTAFVNNWDLVDTSAPQIVGGYLADKSRKPLYELAKSESLWERRIAMLAAISLAAGCLVTLISAALTPGQPAHMILYGGLIIFFCFFYTALVFNSRETADNLKKSGAFIPGIRPGQQTGEYIDKVLTRLTGWGALYVTIVCLMPEFLISRFSVPFYFGGTSLLIMVVVIMDFQAQVAAHLMSHQYEGLMKKANLRGYGRPGQT